MTPEILNPIASVRANVRRVWPPVAVVGAATVAALALVLSLGVDSAGATSQAASQVDYVLARDRGLVGSFRGFGGQLNQHVYANISGPAPNLATMEQRVIDLEPQFVRIFFNQSEWTNADRMESFLKTFRLARRANAEINITWQGSTFAFAMRNMGRFANELESLLADPSIDHLWVTMFNEPNTTQRTLSEYEQVYRSLDELLRERGVRHRIRFMGGDLTKQSQAEWLRYMARNMGDLLDAWSVHVYWDFWDTGKIDERLLGEVRGIFATIPEEQRRPLYVTEFGVRGLEGFEGETSFEPGYWPDGSSMSATNTAAFQQAWFNIRSVMLGYSATVKWDIYPAKYDEGTQDHSALGPGSAGWPARPFYNLLRLFTLTTSPRGGSFVDVVPTSSTGSSKLLTAYISPAADLTVLGLDTRGGAIATTSRTPTSYRIGGLPPNSFFRLLVWNAHGDGRNVDGGLLTTDALGSIEFSVPVDSVFALTNTPFSTSTLSS